MSASKEAIEAAAIAMFYQQAGLKPPYPLWEDADSDEKDNCLNDAELALTSAAPAIQAAVLAPILALHKPVEIQVITGDCAEEECDHEDIEDCPTAPYEVCRACVEVAETANMYALEGGAFHYAWPCPTARAATIEGKSE